MMKNKKRIAVLALQGAFIEHERMMDRLGAEVHEVRQRADWQMPKDGLIIPGGESTVQCKLLTELGLLNPIREAIEQGLPVFGTCAGLILMAKKMDGEEQPIQQGLHTTKGLQERIATMDVRVCRNAYGRQLGSFFAQGTVKGIGDDIPMTFIRAPYIKEVTAPDCEILAEVEGRIVAARQGNQLAAAFHPELNDDTRMHALFLSMIHD